MAKRISRRGFVRLSGAAFGAAVLSACASGQNSSAQSAAASASSEQTKTADTIDYLALVNKQHKLPDNWEANVDLVEVKSPVHDDPIKVERKAYEAYKALKKELDSEGAYVDLDSCYRSVAQQQEVMDEFTKEYGAEYAKRIVATPGYSEHHTGLALDLFLIVDSKNVVENEDMVKHPEIWEKVHAKLAEHGFILRYLPQRKLFTGYSQEPWHIRYIDDPAKAKEIAASGLTYEEYLNQVPENIAGCAIEYGNSKAYTEADIDSTIDPLLEQFNTWTGCVMKRFAYAGDDACDAKELEYVNSLREKGADEFKQAIVVLTDFHSPDAKKAEGTAWEPDKDYVDYAWHFGRTSADDAWQLMSWGYA